MLNNNHSLYLSTLYFQPLEPIFNPQLLLQYCLEINQMRTHWCVTPYNFVILQFSKWKFEFTGSNQILIIFFYKCLNKNWKIYSSNKVLLVLGRSTSANCEDWYFQKWPSESSIIFTYFILFEKFPVMIYSNFDNNLPKLYCLGTCWCTCNDFWILIFIFSWFIYFSMCAMMMNSSVMENFTV